jgi:hypothetical protein
VFDYERAALSVHSPASVCVDILGDRHISVNEAWTIHRLVLNGDALAMV